MRTVQVLRTQHQEIVAIVQKMSALLDAQKLANAEAATQMRSLLSQLAGRIKVHLAMEDSSLYPTLVASTNPKTSETAQRFVVEMTPITRAFGAYLQRWPSSLAITRDAAAFIRETQAIFEAVGERVKREEGVLYPLAEAT